uniref:Uncharacterized protein n=1 Tax=Anopheles farauti TaxID=69004 RepID=A0A182Q3Q1_9DIPT
MPNTSGNLCISISAICIAPTTMRISFDAIMPAMCDETSWFFSTSRSKSPLANVLRLISSSEFRWAASIIRESIDEYGRHTPRSSRHCHWTASCTVGCGRSSSASTANIPSVGRRGISSPIRQVISYNSEGLRGTSSTSDVTDSAEPVSRYSSVEAMSFFSSVMARSGQFAHITLNIRTTFVKVPLFNTDGVTTSSC